jgi:hypothetical protein
MSRKRPRTRRECGDPSVCPWIGCRYHLAVEVDKRNGRLRWNRNLTREDAERGDFSALPARCSLTVAAKGRHTLEEIGVYFGVTRERIRQIEHGALMRIRTCGLLECCIVCGEVFSASAKNDLVFCGPDCEERGVSQKFSARRVFV